MSWIGNFVRRFVSNSVGNEREPSQIPCQEEQRFDSYGFSRNFEQINRIYRTSSALRRIIDELVNEMTRKWIAFRPGDAFPQGNIESIEEAMKILQVKERFQEAMRWSILYGGAVIVIDVVGEGLEEPLDVTRIQNLADISLYVLDRWSVMPMGTLDYDHPTYWQKISASMFVTNEEALRARTEEDMANGSRMLAKIHTSRVLRFNGLNELPWFERQREMGWGASILESMYDEIEGLDRVIHETKFLLRRSNIRTIKLDGLIDAMQIGAGDNAIKTMQKRVKQIAAFEKNQSVTYVDSKDEVKRDSYSFEGLDRVADSFRAQLSMACRVPITKFYGFSSSGFSTGDADIQNYYDSIHVDQEQLVRPNLTIILQIIATVPPPEKTDATPSFDFVSLWQADAKEESDIRSQDTQSILTAYDRGLLNDEIALSELKNLGKDAGVFSSITPEFIRKRALLNQAPEVEESGGEHVQ